MVNAAWQGAEDGDVLLLGGDCARREPDEDSLKIIEKLAESARPASLVLNKTDLAPPKDRWRVPARWQHCMIEKIFMVSAETGNGIAVLKAWLAGKMPASPYLFEPDDLSDTPWRLLASEIPHEKLFLNLQQELPYQLTVEPDVGRSVRTAAPRCICRSLSPARGIAATYWEDGQSIRWIGTAARKELEAALDRRVHLFSHVKYRKDWMNDSARYSVWDLDYYA